MPKRDAKPRGPGAPQRQPIAKRVQPTRPPAAAAVLRPDDLLDLRFLFHNLHRDANATGGPALVRTEPGRPATLVVEFRPQHLIEEAFYEQAPKFTIDPRDGHLVPSSTETVKTPARALVAGPSRLAFRVPAEVTSIPYTLPALLRACSEWEPAVVPIAQSLPERRFVPWPAHIDPDLQDLDLVTLGLELGHGGLDPATIALIRQRLVLREPTEIETTIEAPWRLILSPTRHGAWLHALGPVTGPGERTELWHTRLAQRGAGSAIEEGRQTFVSKGPEGYVAEGPPHEARTSSRIARAVWSPDHVPIGPPPPHNAKPFPMSLDSRDRHDLVGLTADPAFPGWRSRVVHADRLMLSASGAWLDLDYATPGAIPDALEIEAWRHRAAMGRDTYVRVVYAGCLCPVQNKASLVKVTERKFESPTPGSPPVAVLRQRMFIVVKEPVRSFPTTHQPAAGRRMPLRTLRITTLVTPDLEAPADSDPVFLNDPQRAFWPTVGGKGKPFLFHLVGTDWDGNRVDLTLPLLWVSDAASRATGPEMGTLVSHYQKFKERRTAQLHGQTVAVARSTKQGETALEAETLELGIERIADDVVLDAGEPRFCPTMASAGVRIPAAERLLGASSAGVATVTLFEGDVLANEPGDVFAAVQPSQALTYPGWRCGALVTPNLAVSALTRSHGPIGGKPEDFAAKTFDPASFFGGATAKILGGINLFDIVAGTFTPEAIPALTSAPTADGAETALSWKPRPVEHGIYKPGPGAAIEVEAHVRTDADGKNAGTTIRGTLSDFQMDLFGFVKLPFASMQFTSNDGAKPDVTAIIGDVTFGGPLAFVNEFRKYIGGDGFSDPPSLDVTSEGARLAFTLLLPTLSVGVMTLANVSFGAALNIPFLGDPARLRFAFCERENPFCLTIYCFGGGGFFAIALGLDGVEALEASFEFGAAISIDIGVASGGVHVMAGIYYGWTETSSGGKSELTGYVRLGGELEVLGIVSMSLEFNLGLTYATGSNGGTVWGEATLQLEIEIAFFSDTIEATARREFGDPDRAYFHEMVSETDWLAYAAAFAADA